MIAQKIKKLVDQITSRYTKKRLVSSDKDIRLVQGLHGKRMPRVKQLSHVMKLLSAREQMLVRVCLWILVFGILWSAVSIIGRYRIEVPDVGGTYIEAVVGSPQLVNPIFATLNDVDLDITRLVFTGLMRYDERQQLVPDLARSVEISDDKKTYLFRLRDDVVWHDGTPFTARDVVFTIQTIQDPLVNSPLLVGFQGVGVEAVDDHTVQFELKEPFAPFLSSLTLGILPEHVWFDVPAERMSLHRNNVQPVGTGPYMFRKLSKDDSGFIFTYDLVRFERFYRQAPFINEFSFQFFGEYEGPSGAIQALRGGRVDGLNFVPHDLKEKVERKHITLHTLQLPQYTGLFFNQQTQPLLKDANLRLALSHALDKDRILRDALRDEGQIIHSPVLPGFPGYNPEIDTTQYAVDTANTALDKAWTRITPEDYKAKRKAALLEERADEIAAGATTTIDVVDEEGNQSTSTVKALIEQQIEDQVNVELNTAQTFYRENKDGEILTLKLVTAQTQEYDQAAKLIAGFWQEVGVKTDIEFVDPKDVSRTILKGRNYDVLLYGMILGSDPDQFPFWHSSQIDFPGLNLARYVNRTVDGFLQKIRETDNQDEVVNLSTKFQDAILSDRPAIFLYMPTYTYATTDKVKGFDTVRIFHPSDRFDNVTGWYLNTKGDWQFSKTEQTQENNQ